VARKVRPQSVVGLGIENLSLSHIPDLLEAPSQRSSQESSTEIQNEDCDSITELPSTSLQLQHLVKSRPKRAKTRAPTRSMLADAPSQSIGEGLETFFRPGSVTPNTLTPMVSPTSEECSSLSFVDSPTMSRDGKFSNVTSGETTPIMEERKVVKLGRSSPLLKSVWTPRSRSTDNLETCSPNVGRKSPFISPLAQSETEPKLHHQSASNAEKSKSPSNESIKLQNEIIKTGNGVLKTPITSMKPRPWSVLGNESKTNEFSSHNDSTKTTPDAIDNGE
jgi:leucine-rich repeat-containing protein 16